MKSAVWCPADIQCAAQQDDRLGQHAAQTAFKYQRIFARLGGISVVAMLGSRMYFHSGFSVQLSDGLKMAHGRRLRGGNYESAVSH